MTPAQRAKKLLEESDVGDPYYTKTVAQLVCRICCEETEFATRIFWEKVKKIIDKSPEYDSSN